MTDEARRALARPSRGLSSPPPRGRCLEGSVRSSGADLASNPGGTQGGAHTGGNPEGEARTSRTGALEYRAPVPSKILPECRIGRRIAGEGSIPSPRPMGATECSGAQGHSAGLGYELGEGADSLSRGWDSRRDGYINRGSRSRVPRRSSRKASSQREPVEERWRSMVRSSPALSASGASDS